MSEKNRKYKTSRFEAIFVDNDMWRYDEDDIIVVADIQ